ncbi:ethanolamine utilization protein EutQ [Mesorhizobium sp. WSM3876]|nr:ethanolamine utilization protein EutQ [Mesorhizobium sp. WSM3876]
MQLSRLADRAVHADEIKKMTPSGIRKFEAGKVAFSPYGDGPGAASISRLVGPGDSTTMGAYLARFDGRSVAWTVRYDELIAGISGKFRLKSDGEVHELGPGDVLWIPEGTELEYQGDDAMVFISIAPVDWRARQAANLETGGEPA